MEQSYNFSSERNSNSKAVYIETLGCQMNKSDAERIYGILSHFGYTPCEEAREADFLIMNTCSIRQLSEEKAYSRIGLWGKWKKKKNSGLKIALCGCIAQHSEENLLARFPFLDLVFGTQNIYELPELLDKIEHGERIGAVRDYVVDEKDFGPAAGSSGSKLFVRQKGTNAWLPIIEGCNNFCTYCIVPYTRGRERSRDFDAIIEEAKNIIAQGYKEITLLGQNVDSYGKDFKDSTGKEQTLANLLREINKINGDFRIRFTTSYPSDITDDLIQAVKESDKVCKYFHIPMQSGDNEILKMMNRRYNREEYGKIVEKIREQIPDVIITSDFIVGFPSETLEQFEQTVNALTDFKIDYSNIAMYSPRPKTPAAKLVDKFIDEEEKNRRFQILNNKVKENSLISHQKCLGQVKTILVESRKDGIFMGRTKCNKIVHFAVDSKYKNCKPGDFIDLKITHAHTWHLKGSMV